ncbi:Glyco-hydro-47 domain containing protein [Pyrenophora tritici-repentis]|nr:Glyco-hydro-47 domain containing protein [Pyrenophora tritici-repentis]KAI1677934.1 Glyco-hydro-47 domain containing protein [Pyrenophora tritici-repentis]
MFRYRRYRAFLVFAVIAVLAIYKFGGSDAAWREAASQAVGAAHGLKSTAEGVLHDTKTRPAVDHETKSLKLHVPAASTSGPVQTPPPVKSLPSSTPAPAVTQQKPSIPSPIRPNPHGNAAIDEDGLESSAEIEAVHWTKLPEKFPVPTESLIKLPSGKPKAIPKIQAKFKKEDEATKSDRIAKLARIQSVAKKSWDGYRAKAWLHDELRPESGTFRDPFAHWGATLVDSLDTLWIMGLKEDFEEAVKAVDQIDFTTTTRADIPLFETTIRYLGGLLAAYDLSGKKYKNLLDKAVELAEVLISAFDTPNRMPETYYYWRPDFASQHHRAGTNVVLAEIGSLSVEFTRLAQLTGEHKYYDAVARITDNLEELQDKTLVPGMWPVYIDASGCGRRYTEMGAQEPLTAPDGYLADPVPSESEAAKTTSTEELSPEGKKYVPLDLPEPVRLYQESGVASKKYEPLNLPDPVRLYQDDDVVRPGTKEEWIKQGTAGKAQIKNWDSKPVEKRRLNIDQSKEPKAALGAKSADPDPSPPKPLDPECIPQGFVSSSSYGGGDEFTLGGMSDSTYEYLPKQYLLLGGQVDKYQTMYEQSMDAVKKHLLFRPMLPKGEDVLFSGKLRVPALYDTDKFGDLTPENAHLTCFTGGMFGMGAKIFNRPEDLEIAKKLTEGCIWSYDMTQTGIMPESFEVAPCEDMKDCAWNETAYWEAIDPRWESRMEHYSEQRKIYESQIASASSWYNAQMAAKTPAPKPVANAPTEARPTASLVYADNYEKRQLAELVDDSEIAHMPPARPSQNHDSVMGGESEEGEGPPTKVQPTLDIPELAPQPSRTMPDFPYVFSPAPVLDHKEYVHTRIVEDRLPKGVTRIGAKNYILRPEAIESVWYMYRITGDNHWREAGWRMFLAIDRHTSTTYGNSAIDDVTKMAPGLNDEMESFWLAETLKYFYLLFAEEDVISLDEWVLNTEAHPFRRPT